MLSLLTRHGRATPLLWLTVDKATLKDHRNAYEDRVLRRLSEVRPEGIQVLIVADRGFGDQKLYDLFERELKFDYVIRFRDNIYVTDAHGETHRASDAHASRCCGDRRSLPGGYRGLCPSERHERTQVSGCEHHHREWEDAGRLLCQTVGNRGGAFATPRTCVLAWA
ncbi:MAG: transposase [Gammaproteobacteria bacterium]